MSALSVRHYVIIGEFDGTTPVTASQFQPRAGQGVPRQVAVPTTGNPPTPAAVGRVSFAALSRSGGLGMFVQARTLSGDASLTMQVRTATDGELEAVSITSPPLGTYADQLLRTVPLAGVYTRPIQIGPTDALAFVPPDDPVRGAVEFVVYEFTSANALAALEAALGPAEQDGEGVQIVFADASRQLDPFEGLQYVFVDADLPAVITLPAADDLARGKIRVTRVGGAMVSVRAAGTDPLNGQSQQVIELAGFDTVDIHRADTGYNATRPVVLNDANLSNAVAAGTVALPAPRSPTSGATLNFSAYGDLVIGDLSIWPRETRYVLERTSAAGEQVRLVLSNPAQRLNGEIDGKAWIAPGDAAVLVRTETGVDVLDSGNAREPGYTDVTTGDVTIEPWGRKLRIVRLSQAAAQTLTLPARSIVPTGAPLLVENPTASAKLIQTPGVTTISGAGAAPATSVSLPAHTSAMVYATATGTIGWTIIRG